MTSRERAAMVVMEYHGKRCWGYDPVQHAEYEELIAAAIDEAVRDRDMKALDTMAEVVAAAVKDRDMEYWEKCCLVDNVAPTPDGLKEWVTVYGQYCSDTESERWSAWVTSALSVIDRHVPINEIPDALDDARREIERRGTPRANEPPPPSPPHSDEVRNEQDRPA